MENLDDFVFAEAFVLNVHHRIVERGVKFLTGGLYLGDAQLLHRGVKLGHYHLNALAVGFVRRCLLERSFKIIINRQELEQRIGFDVVIQRLALFLTALAEIIVLGGKPEVLFLFLVYELLCRFSYFGFFFGFLFGFLFRLLFLWGLRLGFFFGLFFL